MFRIEAFAVEDRAVQLVWRGASGPIDIDLENDNGHRRRLTAEPAHSRGGLVIGELDPGSAYTFRATVRPSDARGGGRFQTLDPPAGDELFRFATMSDLHIGEPHFGLFPRVRENAHPLGQHPERCARAAIAAFTRWGADEVVLKGDLVDHGTHDQWDRLRRLVDEIPQRWHGILGNHETMHPRRINPYDALTTIDRKYETVQVIDRPGVRIVLVETALDDRGFGRVRDDVPAIAAVAETDQPCLVVLHHYVQRFPLPTFWPPGISSRHGNRFLQALARANRRVAVTAGHSHRNRRRRAAGVDHIEVGSVKDYPGVWAGYVVHEGGLRQVVYRVDEPDCLAWTDRTRQVMFGAWRLYAPGTTNDRCFNFLTPEP